MMHFFMTRFVSICLQAVLILSVSVFSQADELAEFKERFQQKISKVRQDFIVESVQPSHLDGLLKVQMKDGPLLYTNLQGEYFLSGNITMYQINEKDQLVDISAQEMAVKREQMMAQLKPETMITFKPEAGMPVKGQLTIFTDVDCVYCQKLHGEVPQLLANGVEVRYMAYPRAGIGSSAYKKMISAWCAADQQGAMTALKNRQTIAMKDCPNPVAEHYRLGKKMGVNGTPAIFLNDGHVIPGYRPADVLLKELGLN